MKNIKKIILTLIAFLILISVYNNYSLGFGAGFCLTGGGTNSACNDVQNSAYGKILGIKISLLGIWAFAILFLVYFLASIKNKYKQNFYEIYLIMIAIGTLSSLYFLSVQFFILKQVCPNCLVIDITTLLVAVLSFVEFKKRR